MYSKHGNSLAGYHQVKTRQSSLNGSSIELLTPPAMTTQKVVEHLIQDCKEIVDYYVDNAKVPGDGKIVIRNAMYARVNRLTFSGFGPRAPFKWLGVRK